MLFREIINVLSEKGVKLNNTL